MCEEGGGVYSSSLVSFANCHSLDCWLVISEFESYLLRDTTFYYVMSRSESYPLFTFSIPLLLIVQQKARKGIVRLLLQLVA